MAENRERIGAYDVVRLIARGGMATVYEAYQPALDRSVALKRLDLRSTDPMQTERFIHESRLSAAFNHPNIVTVFDFFEADGVPYIAMEYLPRGSLRACIKDLSLPQVFGVVECVLKALAHAQEQGVAHRDLKPENVLITRTGAVKIADFGIAKAYHNATLQLSATGMAIGTPTYMAPEQATSSPVGPYTDLYAVGVMTYEMLAGDPPFAGGDSPVSLMYKHVAEPPPPLTGCDPRLAAWVARLLEKAPEARPSGAEEAWRELEPTIVDLLGAFWRNDATLGEIPKQEYVEVVGGDATPTPEPAEDAPAPAGEEAARAGDEYVTVAGDQRAPSPVGDEYVTVAGDQRAAPPDADASRAGSGRRGVVIAGVGGVVVVALVGAAIALGGGDDSSGGGAGSEDTPTAEAAAPFVFTGSGGAVTLAGVPSAGPRKSGAVVVDGFDEPLTAPDAAPQANFGSAVASADFNSDGRADLAVGAAGADSVTVLYGSEDLQNAQTATLPGGGRFGAALAAGDFDGDRYPDLAVGAPDGDGSVRVFLGGGEGLSGERARTLEPSGDLAGGFGSVLAAGDVDHDGTADLVEAGNGHSSYCLGGSDGPAPCTALAGDVDVTALAVGDLDGDGIDDIAQGVPDGGDPVPDEPDTGERAPAGLIRLWLGSDGGPAGDPVTIDQDTAGVRGNDQADDAFGAALAIGDLDGDGFADLVVGAPGEDGDFGRVTIVRGGENGHTDENGSGYGSKTTGLPIAIDTGSRFGAAIALRDADGDGTLDLLVAAPGNKAVVTLPGSGDGAFTADGSSALDLPGNASTVTLGAP